MYTDYLFHFVSEKCFRRRAGPSPSFCGRAWLAASHFSLRFIRGGREQVSRCERTKQPGVLPCTSYCSAHKQRRTRFCSSAHECLGGIVGDRRRHGTRLLNLRLCPPRQDAHWCRFCRHHTCVHAASRRLLAPAGRPRARAAPCAPRGCGSDPLAGRARATLWSVGLPAWPPSPFL